MTKIFRPICLMVALALVLSLVAVVLPAGVVQAQPYAYETPVNAWASSTYHPYYPWNAIDGDLGTHWFSISYYYMPPYVPQWIAFDLGTQKSINAVNVYLLTYDTPMTLDIDVSNDGSTWTTVVDNWTIPYAIPSAGYGDWHQNTFTATQGRYIRLYEEAVATWAGPLRPMGACTEFQARTSPVADFSATPVSGIAPLLVDFTDLSTGNITSWDWDFGDTSTSNQTSPSHTYTDPGTYDVTLTVTAPEGTGIETKSGYISVYEQAVADFYADPTEGIAPLEVQFTDNSTSDIDSWSWDFGDGETSTEQSPAYTYTDPGSYDVTLTVSGLGGTDNMTREGYINVHGEVVPDFSAEPREGLAPLEVQFTDESTGDIDSWSWDFGDEGTSDEQNPTHTYAEPGVYTVSLTASGLGGEGTRTKESYITVYGAVVADFAGSPRSGIAPLTVQFTDKSSGDIDSWSWRFGDGGTSGKQNPSHTYGTPGVYTVSLKVSGAGGTDRETKPDYITVSAPRRPEKEKPLLVAPAMLSVHNLTITPAGGAPLVTPAEVQPNQAVTINAEVVNKGDMRGSKQVNLMINGRVEQSVLVDVPGHSSQPVSFTVYRAEPGVYTVYLEGVTAYFTVLYPEAAGPLGGEPGTGGIIAIVIIGIILIAGLIVAIFLTRPAGPE